MKPKKEQGYVGVLYTEDRQVLGYAFKPETKRLWENAEDLATALQGMLDNYSIETIAKAYKAIERTKR